MELIHGFSEWYTKISKMLVIRSVPMPVTTAANRTFTLKWSRHPIGHASCNLHLFRFCLRSTISVPSILMVTTLAAVVAAAGITVVVTVIIAAAATRATATPGNRNSASPRAIDSSTATITSTAATASWRIVGYP